MNKKVSIAIPCYNAEKYLLEFLESLSTQDYSDLEIIFVSDGSTDRSEEIFLNWKIENQDKWEIKYIKTENEGQAAAVSKALKYITGEYFTWADADDILLPSAIRKKAEYLEKNDSIDIVRNAYYMFDEKSNTKVLKDDASGDLEDIFEGVFKSEVSCISGTYMMRSSLLFECYPEKSIPLSDVGQNFQLLLPPLSRKKCAYINEPLLIYRIHDDSHSNKKMGTKDAISRAQGFYNLRSELLNYCECDKEKFKAINAKLFEDQKRYIASQLLKKTKK